MSDYNLYIIPSSPFTKIPYETLHETLVKKTSLNDLHYHFTCGFACTYIRMMNPTNPIEPQQIQFIEKIMHSPITLIH